MKKLKKVISLEIVIKVIVKIIIGIIITGILLMNSSCTPQALDEDAYNSVNDNLRVENNSTSATTGEDKGSTGDDNEE